MSRAYVEDCGNGVTMETIIHDEPDDHEIRYVVLQNGKCLFNEALIGKHSQRLAAELSRRQEHAAKMAVENKSS